VRKLGIIQPGKIGDIIICLPIAKYYYDLGWDVIWPIDSNIFSHFEGEIFPYVKFLPVPFNCGHAYSVCLQAECNMILDLAFTIPGSKSYNDKWYLRQSDYSFDQYKYYIANVPFEEKWKLSIRRNPLKEKAMFDRVGITDKPFVIVQETSSDYTRRVEWANPDVQRINITNLTSSVFDWLGVLEKAKQHILIESCFTNLIDQLNIKTEKQVLLKKNGYYGSALEDGRLRGEPVLKLDWIKL
jgi:hypothetical protein